MEIKDLKEAKEIGEFANVYLKLESQKRNPSRDGMIDALKDALRIANTEIRTVEVRRCETTPTPWEKIPDATLYNKLIEYQQGMYQHGINKYGEELFKKILGI
jgi:hypothetical protein